MQQAGGVPGLAGDSEEADEGEPMQGGFGDDPRAPSASRSTRIRRGLAGSRRSAPRAISRTASGSSRCSIGRSARARRRRRWRRRAARSRLEDDRPGVDPLVDEVHGHAGHLDPVVDRLLDRPEPGERRQQRGVDVDDASGKRARNRRPAAACSPPARRAARRRRPASRRSPRRGPRASANAARGKTRVGTPARRPAPARAPGLVGGDRDDLRLAAVDPYRAAPAGSCPSPRRGRRRAAYAAPRPRRRAALQLRVGAAGRAQRARREQLVDPPEHVLGAQVGERPVPGQPVVGVLLHDLRAARPAGSRPRGCARPAARRCATTSTIAPSRSPSAPQAPGAAPARHGLPARRGAAAATAPAPPRPARSVAAGHAGIGRGSARSPKWRSIVRRRQRCPRRTPRSSGTGASARARPRRALALRPPARGGPSRRAPAPAADRAGPARAGSRPARARWPMIDAHLLLVAALLSQHVGDARS